MIIHPLQNILDNLKNGDMYIGERAIHGSGTYFTYGKNAHSEAKYYTDLHNQILTATLSKKSKIITNTDLQKKKEKFKDIAFKKATEINKTKGMESAIEYHKKINHILMDDGVFAAALGYDAINVTDARYLVILNRGKVIVSE